jgi:hypothetical protein
VPGLPSAGLSVLAIFWSPRAAMEGNKVISLYDWGYWDQASLKVQDKSSAGYCLARP